MTQFTKSGLPYSAMRFLFESGTGGVRKFAVTAFAVLYGLLILSVSAERSNEWAAREARALRHFASGGSVPCSPTIEKSTTYPWQTKIVEREYAVETPREEFAGPIFSMRHNPLSCSEYHTISTALLIPPRAPPSQL